MPILKPGPRSPAARSEGTQSIVRAANIINLIASYSIDGIRAADIAASLGLARPTAHRILQCLIDQGWVMRQADSKRYLLGHGLFELGLTAAPQFRFRDICQPSLERIARRTGHVSFLTIRSGRDAISIARSRGKPLDHASLQIGIHRPLGIGAGSLALLMGLTNQEVELIVSANARRMRSFADLNTSMLIEIVRLCREQGFASHDRRLLKGVSGVAVPLADAKGQVLGAISITASMPTLATEVIYEILATLRREALHIQALLGRGQGQASRASASAPRAPTREPATRGPSGEGLHEGPGAASETST